MRLYLRNICLRVKKRQVVTAPGPIITGKEMREGYSNRQNFVGFFEAEENGSHNPGQVNRRVFKVFFLEKSGICVIMIL